jgi:hypothetical protein
VLLFPERLCPGCDPARAATMKSFSKYTPKQKQIIALAIVSGGLVVAADVSVRIRRAQKEQKMLCEVVAAESTKESGGKKQKVRHPELPFLGPAG